MRNFLLAWAVVVLCTLARADDNEPKKVLKVGDPAPKLKADKWLQGGEVKEFEPGKIYVVEFWATWCGPCIVMMPHLADLQAEYRDKGVTFIGYTKKDPNNVEDKVAAFVQKRGSKLGYTFAYSDGAETYDSYMKAAGQNGIPCSYVVDQSGRIAFIGHPMYLDLVMPKVVAGTWTVEDVKKLDDVEKDVTEVFEAINKPDAAAGLKSLTDFEAKYPPLSHIPYFVGPKINLLLKSQKFDEAKKMADDVLARAINRDDSAAIGNVSRTLISSAALGRKDLVEMGLRAAEVSLKLAGEKDLGALLTVADAYWAMGEGAKAREYGAKAVAASSSPQQRKTVENLVKKYDDEKKEK